MSRKSVYEMLERERSVAEYVCAMHVQAIIDESHGITMGGNTIADRLAEKWSEAYLPNSMSVAVALDAVRHWVSSAGYNEDGEFVFYLSSHRL